MITILLDVNIYWSAVTDVMIIFLESNVAMVMLPDLP